MIEYRDAWSFLEAYRGKFFTGEWPTIPEMFRITAACHGDRPCLTIYEPDRISLTYRESLKRIEAVARWLYSRGIRRGDKAAVTGKNSPEWAVAYLGIMFAGAVVVPIDYQLKSEETDLLLKTSYAKILFVDEEKYDRYAGDSGLKDVISLKQGKGTYIYDLDGPEAEIENAKETDLAAVLFTSGTMGKPKGVMLTHRNLVSDCYLAQGNMKLFPTDVFYALLPLHHAYTMLAVLIEALSEGPK
jgi:long-chain acyl-CoA synthetase